MSTPLTAVPTPEEVTLTCELCDTDITGKAAGPGSATWKLGTHKRVKHGVQGRGRRKKGAPTLADHDAHPVLASVREAASEIGIGKSGAPSADELTAGLGRGLQILTMGAATLAVETDPAIPAGPAGQADRDLVIDMLTLEQTAARGVMTPIARMFAGTKVNKRYGRAVVDNVDVLGSLFDLGLLMKNWRDYLALRAQLATARAEAGPQLAMAPAPSAAQPTGPGTPGSMEGHVVTAADVERMRKAG